MEEAAALFAAAIIGYVDALFVAPGSENDIVLGSKGEIAFGLQVAAGDQAEFAARLEVAADFIAGCDPGVVAVVAADVDLVPGGDGAECEVVAGGEQRRAAAGVEHFGGVQGQVAPGKGVEAAAAAADVEAGEAVDLRADALRLESQTKPSSY